MSKTDDKLKAKATKAAAVRSPDISALIRTIRGQRVVLDSDLARIYGVPTKRLNEQVKRNAKRFPPDFLFQLTAEEADSLRSQFATLKGGRGQHRKFLPYAFTENGAVMAANVLNSPAAVQMSVFVVRAFVQMRELLGGTKALAKQLADLEQKLTARLDGHESAIVDVLQRLMQILDPPPLPPEPEMPKRRIGFHVQPEEKPVAKARKKA
jgi:phage regulator Rha-like protein